MHTRHTPKRAAELVAGGSLFWVFKGFILCRQAILGVDTVGDGVSKRCEVRLDPALILTLPTPRRAFQGWRYVTEDDAPRDLDDASASGPMPADLAHRLRSLGAW